MALRDLIGTVQYATVVTAWKFEEWDDLCRANAQENYGPIMVQQFFPTRLKLTMGATRVAYFQLVTTNLFAVTALSGSFGNRRAAAGMRGNHKESVFKAGV